MSIAEKLTQIAENQEKVYDAGKQAEHDRLWDTFQQNGNQTDYTSAFAGTFWDFSNFYPRYNLVVKNGLKMLYAWSGRTEHRGSLTERLKECGIEIDVTQATNLNQAFAYGKFTEIPPLDVSNCPSNVLAQAFYSDSELVTIGKLTVNETHTFTNTFAYCNALQNIEFAGTIGQSIGFPQSNSLTTASVQSISDHLADLTGKTAQTVTFHKDVYDKLTEAQRATIAAKNWEVKY